MSQRRGGGGGRQGQEALYSAEELPIVINLSIWPYRGVTGLITIGIIRFRMLEGVKAVLRLYDMRTLISVRDLSRTLFIGTQRSE